MNKSTATLFKKVIASSVLFAGAAMMVLSTPIAVFADNFDDQIKALENEIGQYQAETSRLRAEADTLQNKINAINAQKQAIQAQIRLNQAKYDQLIVEIEETQRKINQQKEILGKTLANLYVDSEVSGLELVASSKSIGDYMDKQEYRSAIRDKLNESIKKVRTLRQELDDQKVEVAGILKDQQAQGELLAAQENEQAVLLAQTQGQEAAYQNIISQKNSQVASLRAAQKAALANAGGNEGIVYGSSSYPWNDRSMDYNDNCRYSDGSIGADPWGYCYRQCVSYVAWKLNTDGRGNRGYSSLGHASGWGVGGRHIPLNDVRPGDVIVWYIGYYGHVMYVESVGGGMVHISQMNVPYDSGAYSTKSYSMSQLNNGAYEVRRFN